MVPLSTLDMIVMSLLSYTLNKGILTAVILACLAFTIIMTLYWIIDKKETPSTFNSRVGELCQIVAKPTKESPYYYVKTHGEIWKAHANDSFEVNDFVKIQSENIQTMELTLTKE